MILSSSDQLGELQIKIIGTGLTVTMEKLEKIIDIIKALVDTKFTGYVRINFAGGAVQRVEKFEEILKK
jgi:triosephosphate isomerase